LALVIDTSVLIVIERRGQDVGSVVAERAGTPR
jgi:hypothetical protein